MLFLLQYIIVVIYFVHNDQREWHCIA